MNIYNQEKTQILDNPDLSKGHLVQDKKVVGIIPAMEEVKEVSHVEIIDTVYNEDGSVIGHETKTIIDVPYQPYIPEHEEYEEILVYVLYTERELAEIELSKLDNWFTNFFDKQLNQSLWQKGFKVSEDDYLKDENGDPLTYSSIEELIEKAEEVRARIKELRNLLK